ncbi:MAG: hypothetical protein QM702_09645 [Rubrivivax sp.]
MNFILPEDQLTTIEKVTHQLALVERLTAQSGNDYPEVRADELSAFLLAQVEALQGTIKALYEGHAAASQEGEMTSLDWFFALSIASGAGSSVPPGAASSICRKMAASTKANPDYHDLLKLWSEIIVGQSGSQAASPAQAPEPAAVATKPARRRRERVVA